MKKLIVITMIMLFALMSGGCAVVPALITTGASFAVPQAVSLAITAAGTAHKTVLIAADERDVDDMLTDKLLTIEAQAKLLDNSGVDADTTCLNGDLYVVGEYATPADRDEAIEELQAIDGIHAVKGVLKPMPTTLTAMVEPTIADNHAETVIESGLIAKLHVKSANVDVSVVQGEAVIIGVVSDEAEAEKVVDIVEGLRPKSEKPIKVTSLLALQDLHDSGREQANNDFALLTRSQMLAAATPPPVMQPAKDDIQVAALPADNGPPRPDITDLNAKYAHLDRTAWQHARMDMKHRILDVSKQQHDPRVRKELIILSTRVLKDKNTSIEERLVKTLVRSQSMVVRNYVDDLLAEIAPHRAVRLQTLAMN